MSCNGKILTVCYQALLYGVDYRFYRVHVFQPCDSTFNLNYVGREERAKWIDVLD
jgi:hypothetical protein